MSNSANKAADGFSPGIEAFRPEIEAYRADIEALRADILALKQDMSATLDHLKTGAFGGVRNAADKLSAKAASISADLSAQSQQTIKSIGNRIDQQPITSVLVAFAAGFILSRFVSR